MANKYFAKLTKDIVENIRFVSNNMLTGEEIEQYTVKHPMPAGIRTFKTAKQRNAWIVSINSNHGDNTAIAS